jgi:hypothetical protein
MSPSPVRSAKRLKLRPDLHDHGAIEKPVIANRKSGMGQKLDHGHRPRASFSAIGFTDGLGGALAAFSALIFAPQIWLPQMTSRDLVPMADITAALAGQA